MRADLGRNPELTSQGRSPEFAMLFENNIDIGDLSGRRKSHALHPELPAQRVAAATAAIDIESWGFAGDKRRPLNIGEQANL
jgi:hypothetical protein